MRVSFEVKEPRSEGDVAPLEPDLGIIMFNPAGSSCQEDTAREAQALANQWGVTVIAADRPTSHRLLPKRALANSIADNPIAAMNNLATHLDKEISASGLRKIWIIGRSAAATGGMELILTDGLSTGVDSFYAAEPAGLQAVLGRNAREYRTRLQAELKLQKADEAQAKTSGQPEFIYPFHDYKSLPAWRQAYRLAANTGLMLLDVYYNRNHYSQSLVADYLGYVVFDRGVRTHVDIAEHSMVSPSDHKQREDQRDYFAYLQALSGDLFSFTDPVPGTIHKSFDNRNFFAERIMATIGAETV